MSSRVLWSLVFLHFLSGLTQFFVDLLQGFVPVWFVVMPSTSWNRLFRCFEYSRVKTGGILVDAVLGEDDRLGVDVGEVPEALLVGFLLVPTGRHISCTGVDLLCKGQDYRFVVTASKLPIDFSSGNLLNVVCRYGNIRCAGCFPHSLLEGWGIGWDVDEDQTVANNPVFHFFSFCV